MSRYVQHFPDQSAIVIPIGSFCSWRRNMHIRIANEVKPETQLRSVVGPSVGRCAFLVELQGNLGEFLVSLYMQIAWHTRWTWIKELKAQMFLSLRRDKRGHSTVLTPALLQNHNGNYLRDSLSGKIDVPAVRVLRPGTFSDFREWKIQKSGGAAAVGQVKVPQAVVVWGEGCWRDG
ncbi:hypothetical protein PISMIDRAFT_16009 [Pisolithus microcarpus 441]|uniref:GH3 C-terminal domain-containing protein n=1 Tax=Pisolithus microcarpus 441 TaxID=765257 RepID=A0A0C9XUW3_9AGAM|nr:hypothetical protein PISMIDRAFT_16009 [Pisolithus microcarpus 441]